MKVIKKRDIYINVLLSLIIIAIAVTGYWFKFCLGNILIGF